MKVKEAMHKGAICVDASAPVRDLAKVMKEQDIGAVAVKANGDLIGIVTDRDLACRALGGPGDIGRMTAADVMTRDVVSCSPDDDLEKAIKAMEAKHIRRLPVTDSSKQVIGMLSLGDISHKASRNKSGELLRAVSAHHA